MNFVLVTVPIRAEPGDFPPVGASSLLETMIKAGYAPKFYDIDAIRPSFEEVVGYFRRECPDLLGISAVVSTSYRYVKELTHAVKRVSPKTKIILGGCLAASAEILMTKCPIDVCVIGEGERVLINLIKHWERYRDFNSSPEELQNIKGIAFIDNEKRFIFTGYEIQLAPEELPQPNYELLASFSDIRHYIFDRNDLFGELRGRGERCCYVMTGKGCVARCTFCHRWMRGYRSYPVNNIIDTMKHLKKKYNVGFFMLGDESFGADAKMLDLFIEAVKPLNILFRIGGVRVAAADRKPDMIRRLKEAGCVEMVFGMESGSDKILAIMEKGVTGRQNLKVMKLMSREEMSMYHQLVIGMPGENNRTIKETIDCVKLAAEDMRLCPHDRLSINYFQALPGTPGYEFLRLKGLLGKTLDDEETYLLKVSDVNASSPEHYLNVSEEPISKVLLWPYRIRAEVMAHWYSRRGWRKPRDIQRLNHFSDTCGSRNAIRRIWYSLRETRFYYMAVALLGDLFWTAMLFPMRVHLYGLKKAILFTFGLRPEDDRSSFIIKEPKSLRKIATHPDPKGLSVSEASRVLLRMGR